MNVRGVQKCRGTSYRFEWRSTSNDRLCFMDLLTQITLSNFLSQQTQIHFVSAVWNKIKQAKEFRKARLSAPVKDTLAIHRTPSAKYRAGCSDLRPTPTPNFSICFTHHFTITPHPSSGNFRSYSPLTLLNPSNSYPGAVSLKWALEALLLSPVS